MDTVAPGYSRPVNGAVSADAERVIAAACPGAKVEPWGEEPNRHPYWGPWRRVATGYAGDPRVRFQGSSGGVVTALALHALKTGRVNKVLHVAPDPDHPTRNLSICSATEDEVLEGAGSRYASSSPLAAMEQILRDGDRVAFIGKPCDVSALRRLARVDGRVARHAPIALSFFCAGVPSHNAAGRILEDLDVPVEDLAAFRYRGNGWPGMARATMRDGRYVEMSYEESWGGRLSHEVQYRCKICPDAVGGVADVTCADAWYGGETGYPTFVEQDGRSLVISRTALGQDLLASALRDGDVLLEDLDIDQIDLMQPSQARRKRQVASRVAALVATGQPWPDMRGTMVGEAAQRAGPAETAKSFLGSLRRILIRRR